VNSSDPDSDLLATARLRAPYIAFSIDPEENVMSTRQKTFTAAVMTLIVSAVLALAVLPLAARGKNTPPAKSASVPAQADLQKRREARGGYIVSTAGCHDCHTPWKMGPKGPEPDMSRALSGHPESVKLPPPPKLTGAWVWAASGTNTAFSGPWGVSYTANLTPDKMTGIGIWTEDIFVKTIRSGRHWGVARPILPPMPWSVYRNLTDEDLKSVFAYLRTIKPVKNQVPEPLPPPAPASAG
jgi:mono/diheme cytochrome c family protein